MAELYVQAVIPAEPQRYGQVTLRVQHVVYRWGMAGGFIFSQSPSGFFNRIPFMGLPPMQTTDTILIPIDPLTAIGLSLVSPEELEYPEGILAAFNILRGHSK